MRLCSNLGFTLVAMFAVLAVAMPARGALIAAYGFENATNRLQDGTGNGNTLVQNSTDTPIQFINSPVQNGFYYFELGDTVAYSPAVDTNRYLKVPDAVYPKDPISGTGGSFTFAGLVCPSSGGGWRTILSSDKFRFTFRVGQSGGTSIDSLHLGVWNAAGTGLSNANSNVGTAVPDTWYFAALRYDHVAGKVDGFLQDASGAWNPLTVGLSGSSVPASFNTMSSLALGFNVKSVPTVSGADAFAGMMDNVQFYTTALSDAELEARFFQLAVPEPSSVMLLLAAGGLMFLPYRRRRGR
ncbi:MAG: LamG-like jellyroll fold domain-containing protein [Patescibacteria group bacterium]|nr:LamG-like jellyroll fold domain-containing protein [Patescibacteria group bacterium]